jgi:hypothetical protein
MELPDRVFVSKFAGLRPDEPLELQGNGKLP